MEARILATGSYLPDQVIPNAALTQFPPATLPLIEQKTGVKQRRHARADQCTSDLAFEAAVRCLDSAGIAASDLDGIIVATSSPDRVQPATAARLQHLLNASRPYAFDVNSVCTGGVYALRIASALVCSGQAQKVLVIGSEIYSRHLNPKDFSTYPYFGDGAGAALVTSGASGPRIVNSVLHTDGGGHNVIQIPAGGTMCPHNANSNPTDIYFKMNGKEVFQFAVTRGTEVIREVAAASGLEVASISRFVLHQANINVLQRIAENLQVPFERFVVNLDMYGNTAAASVLIALDELLRQGVCAAGDYVAVAAFGGGLSWGANLLQV